MTVGAVQKTVTWMAVS